MQSSTHVTPTNVALLGLGTVGGGVYQRLSSSPRYRIVGCAVRRTSHYAKEVPARLLSDSAEAIANSNAAIVVEALGGLDPAYGVIARALERGQNVVTANKAVIAKFGDELRTIAARSGARLAYSAAVGGEVPVLETIDQLDGEIQSIRGVLSGTANFVLDALSRGVDFEDAVRAAQAAGLAEADPSRDISGLDVAEKLVIIVERAFGRRIATDSIDRTGIGDVRQGKPKSTLVAETSVVGGRLNARVSPQVLHFDDPLSGLTGAQNRVVITTSDGRTRVVEGLGAGRWPTTKSVLSDITSIAGGAR